MTRQRHSKVSARRGILVAALLCLFLSAAHAAPQRIASMSLCADQLLLQLTDRQHIVSVTRFAALPSVSGFAGEVGDIPRNRGSAEEILPLDPDLVIAGEYTAPGTKALLRKLGIPLLEIKVASDFNGVRETIRRIANAVDADAAGTRMIDGLDRRLAATRDETGPRPALLFYRLGGYSQGQNTLMDAIIRHAGFENYAARSLPGVGRISLETILLDPPDAIALGSGHTPRSSRAAEVLAHPAFRQLLAVTPSIAIPDNLWICGLPASVAAVEQLAAFRRSITQGASRKTARAP